MTEYKERVWQMTVKAQGNTSKFGYQTWKCRQRVMYSQGEKQKVKGEKEKERQSQVIVFFLQQIN